MAVALEFIDLLVPRKIIDAKYPGGWKKCLEDHSEQIGGTVWFDAHLFRDGAMSANDMKQLVEWWSEKGLEPTANQKRRKIWKDCCVIESIFGKPTLPCSWIEILPEKQIAYLKGTEPGPIAGRATVAASDSA